MEQHPVPQNVTTFQFRLIGDMTMKQFGYLAGGAILAYISYKLPLPLYLNWFVASVFGLGGVGFAFVPIEERPMDVWVLSFFKNVYSPTQFTWQKAPPVPLATKSIPPAPQLAPAVSAQPIQQTQTMGTPTPALATIHRQTTTRQSFWSSIMAFFAPASGGKSPQHSKPVSLPPFEPTPMGTLINTPRVLSEHHDPFAALHGLFSPANPKAPPPTPFIPPMAPLSSITGERIDLTQGQQPAATVPIKPQEDVKKEKEIEEKAVALEQKVGKLQEELTQKTTSDQRILELQKQLMEVMNQRGTMEQELVNLKKKLEMRPAGPAPIYRQAGVVAQAPATSAPTIRMISPDAAKSVGLPKLTTFPNIITGIVKDGDGNLLPGVLVTVRDKEEVPLRALKTNKLGQFAASTPMPNGTYVVEVEDPRTRFTFDRIQFTLGGTILPALEIRAKSQKELTREKLTKEIFGNQM